MNQNKKRIMFLHSGAELYGADQILLSLVCHLNKRIFDPIVVLPSAGPLVEKLVSDNIRVEIISYPILRRKYFNVKGILNYIFEFFSSCQKLRKFIRENGIEIVHNNTIAVLEGIYLKKKTNVKLVSHVHEMLEKPKIVAKFLYGCHLKYADSIVVVSKAVKKYMESYQKKHTEKIRVIHNGIAPIRFNSKLKEAFIQEFNLPDNAKVAAIVGRINAIKGQKHFVLALEKIIKQDENVFGIIVGDAFAGQEWRVAELENFIHERGLENYIKLCGFRKDINELYQIINVLILPSIQYDSFPTVVLEAMSCGIPTIAYKCGGVEEMIINDKNGYLITQGDFDELSKKLAEIMYNPELFQHLCEQSKRIFEQNFTIDNFIKKFTELYLEGLNK